MNRLITALAIFAAVALPFGWWGLNTVSGRRSFDEMAGIIPLAVGSAGAAAAVIALCALIWRRIRRDDPPRAR